MANKYIQDVSWYYGFDDATLDRRVGRESVILPMCSRLEGIDGNHEGGLRPYPGLRQIQDGAGEAYELDFYGDGVSHVVSLTSAATPNTGGTFTVTVTAPEHGSVTSARTTAPIAFDATVATIEAALEALTNVGVGDVDVVASGSGTDLGDADTVLTFTFGGGLALQPVAVTVDLSLMTGGDPASFLVVARGQHNHNETSEVSDFFPVTFLKEADHFCRGFVYRARGPSGGTTSDVLIDFWDSSTETWTGGFRLLSQVSNTEPMNVQAWGRFVYVNVRGEDSGVFYFDSGDSAYRVTTPCGPGKRIPVDVEDAYAAAAPGNTATAEVLNASGEPDEVGHLTVVLNKANANLPVDQREDGEEPAVLLEPGSYSVAIRLLDSTTGRRSGLSEIAEIDEARFTDTEGDFELNYMGVRIVWDRTKFDKAEIFRSVQVEGVGSTMAARIVHSVKTIVLEDYAYDAGTDYPAGDDTQMDQALWYFELDDVPTSWHPPYMDNRLFDEEVPKGGASVMIDNTFFIGNITGVGPSLSDEEVETDKDRRIGQLRWSSTVELSPELFSPNGYYNLQNPGSEIIALTELAGNALGFSKDRQFHLRREGRYVRVHELHKGYGITGPHAYQTVASMCYFMTDKGLKSVGANGQLDDVRSVNRIILKEWSGELEGVTMALDGLQSCLYILNPVRGEVICMWFNTARVTTLSDMSFVQCRSGYWSSDDGDAMWQLEPRAFFLVNAPKDDADDVVTGFRPRIFVPDHRRQKLIGSGSGSSHSRCTLLDFAGDSRFITTTTAGSSGVLSLSGSGMSVPNAKLEGAWVYVLSSPDPLLVGKKAQIRSASGNNLQLTEATKGTLLGLPVSSRVGLSPVRMEIVGAPLDQRAETGEVTGRNRFHVRHVASLGVYLSEVGGYPLSDSTNDDRVIGQLYRTEGAEEPYRADSYGEDGTVVSNVAEAEMVRWTTFGSVNANGGQSGVDGTVLCPSLLSYCPDLDFVLLAMEISGKMQSTTNTTEPTRL